MLGIKPLLTKISDPLIIRPVCLWVKGGVELDQMAGGRTWKSQTSSEGELRMSGCVPNMFVLHHLPWEEFLIFLVHVLDMEFQKDRIQGIPF